MLKELLVSYIGCVKALSLWIHSAHHVSKGPSFGADHDLLYGKIYETVQEDFDKIVEKSIVMLKDETCACPVTITKVASIVLSSYSSPVEKDSATIASNARDILGDHIIKIGDLYQKLEENKVMTLGMNDYLSSSANQYEEYYYLLGQRCKEN